jgi:hypothetical protein
VGVLVASRTRTGRRLHNPAVVGNLGVVVRTRIRVVAGPVADIPVVGSWAGALEERLAFPAEVGVVRFRAAGS